MVQRISNDGGSAASRGEGLVDAKRRENERSDAAAETRERGSRFRQALAGQTGQTDARSANPGAANPGPSRAGGATASSSEGVGAGGRPPGSASAGGAPGAGGAGGTGGAGATAATGAAGVSGAGGATGAAAGAAGGTAGAASASSPAGEPTADRPHGLAPHGGAEALHELDAEVAAIEKAAHKVLSEAGEGEVGGAAAELLNVAPPPAWARPEGPARVEHAPRELPSPLPGSEAYHRLLLGQGPAGAEARLSITQGPLAGLQLHLQNGPGGIQASVLAQGASNRQALLGAMDEVARRLRQKGHQLEVRFGAAQRPAAPPSTAEALVEGEDGTFLPRRG